MLERTERKRAVSALRRGLDEGMSHIDTAEMYGFGAVEEIVGEAIARRRSRVFLASKVLPGNASRRGTVEACERSLRRLKTDWLDLYLLHWPGPFPLEGTLEAFEELRRRDLIGAVGIAGEAQIACNQVLYHLGERAIEHDVIPWCKEHRIAVVAYSPFGSGQFPSASTKGGRVLHEIAAARRAT